jgi:hypothetical protein
MMMRLPVKVFKPVFGILFCLLLLTAGSSVVFAEMIDYPRARLQSLDKVTARTMTFEAQVGSTVKFGTIYIKVRACKKSEPIDRPESSAFLQVWEIDNDNKASWVFSGWMYASSPALSSMDHPIYDVWVLDCLSEEEIPDSGEGDPQATSSEPQQEQIETAPENEP